MGSVRGDGEAWWPDSGYILEVELTEITQVWDGFNNNPKVFEINDQKNKITICWNEENWEGRWKENSMEKKEGNRHLFIKNWMLELLNIIYLLDTQ